MKEEVGGHGCISTPLGRLSFGWVCVFVFFAFLRGVWGVLRVLLFLLLDPILQLQVVDSCA